MRQIIILIIQFSFFSAYSQFAPPAGQIGSTAIHADSSIIINWAKSAKIRRGYLNISNPEEGLVDGGEGDFIIGESDGSVVSLGDSGVVVLDFDPPITNDIGWDFAVFENGFDDAFLELAFVEVSSDGEKYFRFPSSSLTDTSSQIGSFGILDATKLNNLAGKYRVNYGTPFDLDSIPDDDLLNKKSIRFIKIIDVVGSIDPRYNSKDSKGNIINDPFPTAFESGGFDLDAVGVIHQKSAIGSKNYNLSKLEFDLFPSPATEFLNIKMYTSEKYKIEVLNINGLVMLSKIYTDKDLRLDLSKYNSGLYYLKIIYESKKKWAIKPFVKL